MSKQQGTRRRLVKCSRAAIKCAPCPHRRIHAEHYANENEEWDTGFPCTKPGVCYRYNGKTYTVKCIEVKL